MEKKETNPKDGAATTRLDFSLLPATAQAYGALAMTEGDLKYGGYNYRIIGVKASIYYSAARRHLDKWFNGQWADKKTKVPHLASALACIGVLIDAIECDKLNDDRPPKCDIDALLTNMEDNVAHLQKLFPNRQDRYTEVDHPTGTKENRSDPYSGSSSHPNDIIDESGSKGDGRIDMDFELERMRRAHAAADKLVKDIIQTPDDIRGDEKS